MTLIQKNATEFVTAKILVPNLLAEEWFISGKTVTSVHIPELFEELPNGTIPIRYVPLLKEISITSKKISVWQVAVLRMKKRYMLT